jgi:hypothetical protein
MPDNVTFSGSAADHDAGDRSAEACPVCGAHRLAILHFPELTGGATMDAKAGIGVLDPDPAPSPIGCLACGAEWPDLDAFREAAAPPVRGSDANA